MKKLLILIVFIPTFLYSQEKDYNKGFELYEQYSDSLYYPYKATRNFIAEEYSKVYESHAIIMNEYYITKYYNSYNYTLGFENFNNKTIKYISVTLVPYNAVDDICGEIKTVKGVGPIEPKMDMSCTWENLWYGNKIISYCKIRSIKIEYTDKTFKTIYGDEIYSINKNYEDFNNSLQVCKKYLSEKHDKILLKLIEELKSIDFIVSDLKKFKEMHIEKYNIDIFEEVENYLNILKENIK